MIKKLLAITSLTFTVITVSSTASAVSCIAYSEPNFSGTKVALNNGGVKTIKRNSPFVSSDLISDGPLSLGFRVTTSIKSVAVAESRNCKATFVIPPRNLQVGFIDRNNSNTNIQRSFVKSFRSRANLPIKMICRCN